MKYFYLQLKKLSKVLPFAVIVSFILIFVVLTVLAQFSAIFKSEQDAKFTVAVAGDTNSRLFNFGIIALKTLDSSRMSIEIIEEDKDSAKRQLLNGEISAYAVIPKDFFKYARHGEIIPITYCTTASTVDISGIMRDEITKVLASSLKEAQKGAFGEEQLLIENGYEDIYDIKSDELAFKYVDFIIDRSKMYKTEIIGASYGLDLVENLTVGQIIIFLCVLVIPFCAMLTRRDNGILKALSSKSKGPFYSAFCEYFATFFTVIITLIIIGILSFILSSFFKFDIFSESAIDFSKIALCLVPVVAMICAFAFVLEELSGNILSCVLGSFFIFTGLSYISGCIYPLYALPPVLQKIAAFTPTGLSRSYLCLTLQNENCVSEIICIFIYTLLFFFGAVIVRKYKVLKGDGA